ncbi:heme transporter HRG1-like [Asterias amurensis]|uniref:heme transporter HRG1-like n=1 Tax=Asterias amurensis TaxID=7602 RepID=UPI003AB5F765
MSHPSATASLDDASRVTPPPPDASSIQGPSVKKQGAAMEPSRTAMRVRFVLASTGISLGCLVFMVFLAVEEYRNFHIAIWGLVSGIFAALTLIVHIQHTRGDRDVWVNRLKAPIIVGFIVQLGSIAAFITYIVLALVEKQTLMPVTGAHHGYYLTAIWVFMTWKWSFALFFFSRSYRKFYITKYVSIP